jgi:hypothetical protein
MPQGLGWSDEKALTVGLAICTLLACIAIWDYWLAKTGRTTISRFCRQYHDKPKAMLFLGLILGFTLGIILGFICGHLVWPQPMP